VVKISAVNFCTLAVKVIPGASRDELCGWRGDILKVKLSAPPVEGRANDALVAFLAEKLGRRRREITLVRGATARQKLVRIAGLTAEQARAILSAAG